MVGKLQDKNQRDLFRPRLEDLINPNHELALLANAIDWQYFENVFKPYCSDKGAPGVPIRTMAGCLLLKHLYNPGDEKIPEYWVRDVYFQYLCGGVFFEHKFPFDPGDFVHFRKRVGGGGYCEDFCIQRKTSRNGCTQTGEVCVVRHDGSGEQHDFSCRCQTVQKGD